MDSNRGWAGGKSEERRVGKGWGETGCALVTGVHACAFPIYTNVVFALVEGLEIRARWRIATDPRRTADEYAVWLLQLLEIEGYARSDVTQLIIGSVVPRALHNLTVLGEKYFGVTPLVAGQGEEDRSAEHTSELQSLMSISYAVFCLK